MHLPRRLTEAGVNPLDQVQFEKRSSVITNPDGLPGETATSNSEWVLRDHEDLLMEFGSEDLAIEAARYWIEVLPRETIMKIRSSLISGGRLA